MFKKVLIANRGEVALRILRACRDLNIETVMIHSEADEDSMPVRLADEAVCIGPARASDSYLNIPNILSAARITGADAIHPGWGFLSENAQFADIIRNLGIAFIGPSPEDISTMGDKIKAKQTAEELGIPVVKGSKGGVVDAGEARKLADEIGYPVILKAASGGGGRGMKVVERPEQLEENLSLCRSEAKAAFGDDAVYMEKYLTLPRHVEIQLLADGKGNCIHLGERDCSIQRRHQKVIEEAGCPVLSNDQRNEIGEITAKAVGNMGYKGVGTVEYLYENGKFYFIEMNTRLQVEHPVSELITGLDIVEQQIRVASGEELSLRQQDISFYGHAIECRINAENPENFTPSPGTITQYHPPGGLGVRIDSHIFSDYRIPPYYDSLISKLIVHGPTREKAIERLERALKEYVIGGVQTNLPLHQKIIQTDAFLSGDYNIHWLENWMQKS